MLNHQTYPHYRKDHAADELIAALLDKPTYVFNELFQAVHARLQARELSSSGEDMLRLRVYEKLQKFVFQGLVAKVEKKYSAVRIALLARAAEMAHAKAVDLERRGAILTVE